MLSGEKLRGISIQKLMFLRNRPLGYCRMKSDKIKSSFCYHEIAYKTKRSPVFVLRHRSKQAVTFNTFHQWFSFTAFLTVFVHINFKLKH